MIKMILYGFLSISILLLLVFLLPLQSSHSVSSNYTYDLNSVIYGESYQYWASKWWQWHISIPSTEHPRENYSPQRCAVSQGGPVWFLADAISKSIQERECSIPADKSIIIQVLGGECDYGEPNLKSDSDIITCVDRGIDNSNIKTFVDGKEISNFKDKRIGHYWFNISVPNDNIYQEQAGTYKALVDGWFLFLKPFSPGNHELLIQADHTSIGPDGIPTEEDHHTNLKYNLKIGK